MGVYANRFTEWAERSGPNATAREDDVYAVDVTTWRSLCY